jgi:hypothetical protein
VTLERARQKDADRTFRAILLALLLARRSTAYPRPVRARRTLLVLVFSSLATEARAFPGLCLAKDDARRSIDAAEVVVMRHRELSVVTVAASYRGPLTPFALLLPIPADVTLDRVRTVKRKLLARLAEVSAPRFHAFFEQDPCDASHTEQRWEEHVRARGRGFLSQAGVPDLDPNYSVSNEIAESIEPVFKGVETEFGFRRLFSRKPGEVEQQLREAGYALSDSQRSALLRYLSAGQALLLAEVATDRVEIAGDGRVELGGIRYFTRSPLPPIASTLGLESSAGVQDLLLYVLDRSQRFRTSNYDNRFVPSNLLVKEHSRARFPRLYAALFDAVAERAPQAFVTEYAWSTGGCGQPCADAPLGIDELLTLGGDVLEAETTTPKERAGTPAGDTERVQAVLEEQLAARPPAERAAARREHRKLLAEIGRRRALGARQSYVLTRLHHRYTRATLPRDIELAPEPTPLSGGVGVPSGPQGELATGTAPAPENQYQVRLVSLRPWNGSASCGFPTRHRWGKPWPTESRAARDVRLALDRGGAESPDKKALLEALEQSVPELGLNLADLPPPPPAKPAPKALPERSSKGGCSASIAPRGGGPEALVLAGAFALALGWLRRRLGR